MTRPDWLLARPIAHRGYHDADAGRLENTLPAVEAAIAGGFGIEVDVHMTGDGHMVVFHDETLERLTTAQGNVQEMSLAELKTARFRHSDATIPTLEELLDLVSGRANLFVEIKPNLTAADRVAQAVTESLSGYTGPVAVMSFDHHLMALIRSLAPDLTRGMIGTRFDTAHWPTFTPWQRFAHHHLLHAIRVRPDFIAYHVRSMPATAPMTLKHFVGLPLLTWTVRSTHERHIAQDYADQIIFEGFDPASPIPPDDQDG